MIGRRQLFSLINLYVWRSIGCVILNYCHLCMASCPILVYHFMHVLEWLGGKMDTHMRGGLLFCGQPKSTLQFLPCQLLSKRCCAVKVTVYYCSFVLINVYFPKDNYLNIFFTEELHNFVDS